MSNDDYSGRITEIYGLLYPMPAEEHDALHSLLRRFAPGNRVMEYGIGEGRTALPLASAGFDVAGIDISAPMLRLLAGADSDGRIDARHGSFTEPGRTGDYDAVLLMINTIFFAKSLEEQQAVFANAFGELRPGGVFVVETFNPIHYHSRTSPSSSLRHLDPGTVLIEQYTVEPVRQLLVAENTVIGRGDPISWTQVLRYMYPNEMDAIALAAGFRLAGRTADWIGAPYGPESARCISLYAVPAPD
ncbi:methyltransferase domain-containing protein [Rathayibacter sp. VKM Ac-2762]|uniref:class I SAM-dependent methyltransferase n=1 Tax=Rathayibacter sp. VKM Ac-2762 TaxID=2609254 RepID=UPI00132ED901|nr:class I SAM-dependent methyltransferase [Rathayibacter sp. VKM Ac-2762]QHF21628.1 methyltransferase domain-containing protein [Rathayibacter sp. VKM Ac-2762]